MHQLTSKRLNSLSWLHFILQYHVGFNICPQVKKKNYILYTQSYSVCSKLSQNRNRNKHQSLVTMSRWTVLLCGSTRKMVLAKNGERTWGEEKKEGDWIRKIKISMVEFRAVHEVSSALFWPTPNKGEPLTALGSQQRIIITFILHSSMLWALTCYILIWYSIRM